MTTTTLETLGDGKTRQRSVWLPRFSHIHELLREEHGVPSLGNYRAPVREVLYIVLSAKTTDKLYRKANTQLWRKFESTAAIAEASISDIAECIKIAGLGNKRATQVKEICRKLHADFGPYPNKQLRKMTHRDAFDYLVSLPGVGPKSALCVMMYSLDHDTFPVDVNVHRIARRLGALRKGLKHYEAQKVLPRMIPAGTGKELHIGMVVHGRSICTPHRPACERCPIRGYCRYHKTSLRKRELAHE